MKRFFAIILILCLLVACVVPAAAETLGEDLLESEKYALLKTDISGATVSIAAQGFIGMPATPNVTVYMNGYPLTGGQDYVVTYSNNVNKGTATARVIGIGNYYGSVVKEFQISDYQNTILLKGVYMGQADGELTEQTYYSEHIVTPGVFVGNVDGSAANYGGECLAAFELYRLVGEELELVTTYQPEVGYGYNMTFTYDFSSVYEGAVEDGGEAYVLMYVWIDSNNAVYSGTALLAVPAKVPDGTEMVVEELTGTNDFRMKYLSAYSPDGNLGTPTWTSSDTSVATVENGAVTLMKPGKITITAQWGGLSAAYDLTVEQQNIANGAILSYDQQTNAPKVWYQGQLLVADKDYTQSVTQNQDVIEITVTGCGLFGGQLVRQFDATTGNSLAHTHGFDHTCDTTCDSCDFTRTTTHQWGTTWEKDLTGHWHPCVVCGEKTDYAEHTISAETADLCEICGEISIPGDLTGDGKINTLDGLLLMRHLNGWNVQIAVPGAMDVNGDGKVNTLDGLILMRYLNGWNVTLG